MSKKQSKGQSILEYTLLLGAIIAVLIMVLGLSGTTGGSGLSKTFSDTYNSVGNALTKTTSDLSIGVFEGGAGGD
jgi:uncharacterized protein (UPF0333 family)